MRLLHSPHSPCGHPAMAWAAAACRALACLLLLSQAAAAAARDMQARALYPDPVAAAAAASGKAVGTRPSGQPAGTFADPLPLEPPPSTTPWHPMASGHFVLSSAAAGLCRYHLDTWEKHRKLVLAYRERGEPSGGPSAAASTQLPATQFALCTKADDYVIDMWLYTCEQPLRDAGGADVHNAGCSCQLADDDMHAGCPTGMFGWRATVKQPHVGRWYYVVAQANPPETGDEPGHVFTVDVDRWTASQEPESVPAGSLV